MVDISSQFRTILTIFDPPLPPSYSIYGSLSDLRALLSFDSPYTFNFRFAFLLYTISAVSILLYPPLYSIPSPVISVVAMAVTEVPGIYFTLRFPLRFPLSDLRTVLSFDSPFTYDFGSSRYSFTFSLFDSKSSDFCGYNGSYRGSWYILYFTVPSFDLRFPLPIYGSLLRFPTFEPPPTSSKTSNTCITAIIAEVHIYFVRFWVLLVGALSGALGTICTMRQREYFLVLWVCLVSKERVFPCTLGTI